MSEEQKGSKQGWPDNAKKKRPERLSRGLAALWTEGIERLDYDVVIVGSGYGGSVAAHALAGATVQENGKQRPLSVCVLERGSEYLPGEFPSRFSELPAHVRLGQQNTGRVRGVHKGLFDIRLGDDVAALVANGLGGGSLINAGVMLEPRLEDFEPPAPPPHPRHPGTSETPPAARTGSQVLHELISALQVGEHFQQARRLLGADVERDGAWKLNAIDRHPCAPPKSPLRKTEALRSLAQPPQFSLPPLTVSMDGAANTGAVALNRCTLCGDCMTGCNVGAKDSLDTNLLRLAAERGADIVTGASVLSLREPTPAERTFAIPLRRWVLRVSHTEPKLQAREVRELFIHADRVILAAGTLGSPEILMRSRTDKLVFSECLGERFSCNGDNIAAIHGMAAETQGCADEEVPLGERRVGPTITGSVRMQANAARAGLAGQRGDPRPFLLQEFSVPGPMKQLFEEIVTTANMLHSLPGCDRRRHGPGHDPATDPLAIDEPRMKRTLLVGVIGHDDADGTLHLPQPLRPQDRPAQQGSLRIRWPHARRGALLEASDVALAAAVKGLPAPPPTLIANPMWRLLPEGLENLVSQPRGPVLTVHPLGGCPMADEVKGGVVDEWGGVFDGRCRSRVQPLPGEPSGRHDGLVVLDGSVFPASLGVNPALTIAATALRAMAHWIVQWDITPAAQYKAEPMPRPMWAPLPASLPEPQPTSIEIIERLRGEVPLRLAAGRTVDCVVELTLAYAAAQVRPLLTPMTRQVAVQGGELSRLHVYDKRTWDRENLRMQADSKRRSFALVEGDLSVSLRFLHRESSSALGRSVRGVISWLRNRGVRDIYQAFIGGERPRGQGPGDYAKALLRLASHAGEVRRFDYELQVQKARSVLDGPDVQALLRTLEKETLIRGEKRLTYNHRGNPWRQFTELALTRMPAMAPRARPMLKLDARFMANRGVALLRIVRQRDHAKALADLASFGLLIVRIMVSVHLWTFRKPDKPRRLVEPERLPGRVAGADPRVTELVVDRHPATGHDVKIRLAHYPLPSERRDRSKPPLVMIHGYSVSGNTFTHPSLKPSAAEYFMRQGRDVWVVELRTSAGLATATEPWSMEQVALVDIPAALLHIRNVERRPVDVLAHCIGCAMLGMALLSDAREVRNSSIGLGVDTWLTSEQLGLLTAFNGGEMKGGPHPCIRRVILSQKGPVLRYTDSNLFRAFVLQSIRRWLLADDYQFRPPAKPGVSDELLDRLLASLPYPDEDFDVENPLRPCANTAWTATRHRMDALYGRDFSAANLRPETLEAIDDLFGPINLDTVAQTIHFARFNAVTNQRGQGEFVTRARLRSRWGGIRTLAIHGLHNGLADVGTQDLLEMHFKPAGVPITVKPSTEAPYDQLGHQDTLIGRQSELVFEDIEAFLAAGDDSFAEQARQPDKARWVFAVPWIGPRFDLPDHASQDVRLGVLSRPDHGRGRLCLVPARQTDQGYQVQPLPQCLVLSDKGDKRRWLMAEPWLDCWPQGSSAPAGQRFGYLALLLYSEDEVTAVDEAGWPHIRDSQMPAVDIAALRDAMAPSLSASGEAALARRLGHGARRARLLELRDDLLCAAAIWMHGRPVEQLNDAFVRREDIERVLRHVGAAAGGVPLRLAVGSCQYPRGLLDERVAGGSLAALAQRANDVDLAFFLGDQIYADATAGLVDPVRGDELYEWPHEQALRLGAMRGVLRRLPARMLLDDHEIVDNWEPLPHEVSVRRPQDAKDNEQRRSKGFAAWRHYQRMRERVGAHSADNAFTYGGRPFYLLDTRTGRTPRGSLVAERDQVLFSERQWQTLSAWLLAHREELKFVATPAMLLPRRRATAYHARNAAYSDAWDGYAASMQRLFEFIVDKGIRRTVFLSGDEHHALVSRAWLRGRRAPPGDNGIRLLSIHGSALYAPMPFANGRPTDLQRRERFDLGRVSARVASAFAPPGDGFVHVEVVDGNHIHVSFIKGDGTPAGPGRLLQV
jgi:choline dehydrogenase-like flavoprotein